MNLLGTLLLLNQFNAVHPINSIEHMVKVSA